MHSFVIYPTRPILSQVNKPVRFWRRKKAPDNSSSTESQRNRNSICRNKLNSFKYNKNLWSNSPFHFVYDLKPNWSHAKCKSWLPWHPYISFQGLFWNKKNIKINFLNYLKISFPAFCLKKQTLYTYIKNIPDINEKHFSSGLKKIWIRATKEKVLKFMKKIYN